jgi:hypothetical protein
MATLSSSTSAPPTSVNGWKPDLFAQKFVPRWQQNINSFQARRTFIEPPPPYVDFQEYAQAFLPKPLFHSCPSSNFLQTVLDLRYAFGACPFGPRIPLQDLEIANYAAHFYNELIEERQAVKRGVETQRM